MADGRAMEPLVRRSDVRRMLSRLASLHGIPEASFIGYAVAALPALALLYEVPEMDDELPRTSRSGRPAPAAALRIAACEVPEVSGDPSAAARSDADEDPPLDMERVLRMSRLSREANDDADELPPVLRDTDPAPPPMAEVPRGDAATIHDIRDRLGLVDPEATPIPDGAA